ncbi:MAG: 2-succinyl-5-enolpyruvyl-6-hydroxy-3-cyclohexene-1-carboxylic-acid synthase, partial [Actinomycetota bacterium]
MNVGDLNLACAWALVDELAAGGVQDACLSPGSRSTPLALALSRHPGIRLHVLLDERSSGFVAIGIARASRRAVAVACTSGTAASELLPAIVEASQARVPLIVLTADRPPRVRGTGANQTIDQIDLYGRYARTFVEPPLPVNDDDVDAWRRSANDAIRATHGLPIGPSHVNCPFDEPLHPGSGELPPPSRRHRRPSGPEPWEDLAGPEDIERIARAISGRRGAIVAGPRAWEDSGHVASLAEGLGWPIFAEPLSGLRRPGGTLSAGQAIIGVDTWTRSHRPEVILQIGAAPTTRAMQGFVASTEQLVVVDVHHLEPDPEHRAAVRVRAQPGDAIRALLGRPTAGDGEPFGVSIREGDAAPSPEVLESSRIAPAPFGWVMDWEDADRAARSASDGVLDADPAPSGLQVARDVAASIPDGGILFVGNSTPVRDLDVAMAPREGLTVLGNRGASGIDGLVSTALGIGASDRGPTYALLGDLS